MHGKKCQEPSKNISETQLVYNLQTWLDQFTRTNGGSAPAEYSSIDRVRLLNTLKVLVEKMMTPSGSPSTWTMFEPSNTSFRSAVDRVIHMAGLANYSIISSLLFEKEIIDWPNGQIEPSSGRILLLFIPP